MTDTIIAIIKEVQEGLSAQGKTYWKVETNIGKFSIWEKEVAEHITKGREYDLSYITSKDGNFRNIVKAVLMNVQPGENQKSSFASLPAVTSKEASFYASYAKDIFIQLLASHTGEQVDENILLDKAIMYANIIKREMSK